MGVDVGSTPTRRDHLPREWQHFLIFMVISYSVFADTCRIAVTAYQEAFRRAGVDGSASARQVGNVIQGLSVVNNRGLSPHPHLGLVAQ